MDKYTEAIIELEELIDGIIDGCGSVRLREAAELAIDLIKKREPMKPYFEHGYFCSGCNSEIVPGTDYCWNCGQKLNWED